MLAELCTCIFRDRQGPPSTYICNILKPDLKQQTCMPCTRCFETSLLTTLRTKTHFMGLPGPGQKLLDHPRADLSALGQLHEFPQRRIYADLVADMPFKTHCDTWRCKLSSREPTSQEASLWGLRVQLRFAPGKGSMYTQPSGLRSDSEQGCWLAHWQENSASPNPAE